MKNSLNDDNKFDFSNINIETIGAFCKSHIKHISAGVLTIILIIVLAVTAVKGSKENGGETKAKTEEQGTTAYEVNKNKEMNTLIQSYYDAYAAGEVDKLAALAVPVSDMEKSYIQMMSQYVDSYSNLTCYTKKGLDKTSYLVSVTFDMKFAGIEGALPGLDFFYVKTNEEGKLSIDNLYSSFNAQMNEQQTDEKITARIEEFQKEEDVKTLQSEFQDKYTKVIEADANLKTNVDTVAQAIQNWVAAYAQNEAAAAQAAADKAAADQAAADKAVADQAAADQAAAAAQAAADKAAADQAAAAQAAAAAQQPPADNGGTGLNYLPEGKVLTATDGYNIRVSMSEGAEKVGTVAVGDTIKVILSYEEGWTKVEWNGKKGFIRTDLLLKN